MSATFPQRPKIIPHLRQIGAGGIDNLLKASFRQSVPGCSRGLGPDRQGTGAPTSCLQTQTF